MLINLRHALMAGRHTPTAKDYVQSGLVAMWDGIENAGWGVHDPNATTWRDLVGSHVLSFPATPSWTDNAYILDGVADHAPSCPAQDIFNAIVTGLVTIEIASKSTDGTAYGNNGFFGLGRVDLRSFWFWNNARVTIRGTETGIAGMIENNTAATYSLGSSGAFKNGLMLSTLTFGSQEAGGSFYIGRIPVYKSQVGIYDAIHGVIHSLRVYSRALTAQEIAHNYAIDKARFNLP